MVMWVEVGRLLEGGDSGDEGRGGEGGVGRLLKREA